jgi:biopolymer transport protein ExbD/biopolymer transport protein TolR
MNYLLEVCLVVALAAGATPAIGAKSQAITPQTTQKGISVELPVTSNAVAMPDAEQEDALIVSVTDDGSVYFGVDPISPAALAEKVRDCLSNRTERKLYIKADARSPYANVVKVLDAMDTAGVEAPNLLTAQRDSSGPGTLIPPKGLEVLIGSALPAGSEAIFVQVVNSEHQRPALTINNEPVQRATLLSRLRQLLQNRSENVVHIQADATLPFAAVVDLIDACHSTGVKVVVVAPVR